MAEYNFEMFTLSSYHVVLGFPYTRFILLKAIPVQSRSLGGLLNRVALFALCVKHTPGEYFTFPLIFCQEIFVNPPLILFTLDTFRVGMQSLTVMANCHFSIG